MHKKTTKSHRVAEKQVNGRLRSARMTIQEENGTDNGVGYSTSSFGKSRSSDSWGRGTERGSWSEDIENAASRRILEQWNVVERTLYGEEEQLAAGPLFDECAQWRSQLPHLRIVAHGLFDEEEPERKSTAASSKPSSAVRRREKSAQRQGRNDKGDDFLAFESNFFSTEASLLSSHQLTYRQAKEQVLDYIVEFICKELAEIEAERAAEDLSDEFNELLKVTPAPTTTGKNPLVSNNFYCNVESSESSMKNNGDKGKEKEPGMIKDSRIRRNKLGTVFNERIIVSPVPFIATSRESFTTLRMTPIQYLADNHNGICNSRSYAWRENTKRKLPLTRKTPLIAAPHVQSTWNTPVCPTIWPKNFKLTPIDTSRLPSSKRRPTKTAESVPARRSRNSLSPISRSVQPSSPRSCTRGDGLYDGLEIRGSHIVARPCRPDGKTAKDMRKKEVKYQPDLKFEEKSGGVISVGKVVLDRNNMPGKSAERNLTALSRIVGICTAVVTCGVGADFAFHGHVLGFYVLAFSAIIFFLETQWVINVFIRTCGRSAESFGVRCWSVTLAMTSGWRRGLFYLPIACLLAWKPHKLWLSFFNAGLLVILSVIYAATSALDYRSSCQFEQTTNSMGQSLLNTTTDYYNHFEEVLVTEVLDDCVSSRPGFGETNGDI